MKAQIEEPQTKEQTTLTRISGETKLLCVIGNPIAHSLSPQIHNAFISSCGLDYVYLAFPVEEGGLSAFVQAAKTLEVRGFNVTMPHKEAIVSYMDYVSEQARQSGAVNTVAIREGRLHGHNTDGEGFMQAVSRKNLTGLPAFDTVGKSALILGRGGAARTIALTLVKSGMQVSMAARSKDLPIAGVCVKPVLWEEIAREAAGCDMLVNATPLGMHGQDFDCFSFLDCLPKNALVVDLIYAPRRTKLLEQAHARGLRTMNGIPHLTYQAALSFEFFTGAAPPGACVAGLLEELEAF
jgi:shikimate dehydrogenase